MWICHHLLDVPWTALLAGGFWAKFEDPVTWDMTKATIVAKNSRSGSRLGEIDDTCPISLLILLFKRLH